MKFNALAVSAAVYLSHISSCQGFTAPGLKPSQKVSSTQLYIIGPMIRKMKAEQEKNKMPMASEDERQGEATGLRVGSGAWKWPPVWPYTGDDFTPKKDIKQQPSVSPMAGLMGGNMPVVDDLEEEAPSRLDVFQYWGEEKASVKTELDAEAVKALKE